MSKTNQYQCGLFPFEGVELFAREFLGPHMIVYSLIIVAKVVFNLGALVPALPSLSEALQVAEKILADLWQSRPQNLFVGSPWPFKGHARRQPGPMPPIFAFLLKPRASGHWDTPIGVCPVRPGVAPRQNLQCPGTVPHSHKKKEGTPQIN